MPGGPHLSLLRRHTTSVVIPTAGPCEGLSQFTCDDSPSQGNDAVSNQAQDLVGMAGAPGTADMQTHRLSHLHAELGKGEGVTQLVRASLNDLSTGGTGVVATFGPPDTSITEAAGAAECFIATVDFFDRLCSSSSTLVPVVPHRRQSMLRTRLECINEKLHSSELQGKVHRRSAPGQNADLPM
jgi:hypothetical protein